MASGWLPYRRARRNWATPRSTVMPRLPTTGAAGMEHRSWMQNYRRHRARPGPGKILLPAIDPAEIAELALASSESVRVSTRPDHWLGAVSPIRRRLPSGSTR